MASFERPLQDQLLTDAFHKIQNQNMIKELYDQKPPSGNGYFSITKATLTSMVSVGITWFSSRYLNLDWQTDPNGRITTWKVIVIRKVCVIFLL